MGVIFTPLAERHIDSLHESIATHASEERADGYVSRIVDFCNGLSTFPLRGTQRDDLLPGLRVTGSERMFDKTMGGAIRSSPSSRQSDGSGSKP